MKNKLLFSLRLLPHPYMSAPASRLEAWGALTVTLSAPSGDLILLSKEWDLDKVVQWFGDHQHSLCRETLPVDGDICVPEPTESLAQAHERCFARPYPWDFIAEGDEYLYEDEEYFDDDVDDEADRWFGPLKEYLWRHSLAFALRGITIPNIIIGCNRGVGEISLSSHEGEPATHVEWAYQFHMGDFLSHIRSELNQFLDVWSDSSSDPDVHAYVRVLRAPIQDETLGCCGEGR